MQPEYVFKIYEKSEDEIILYISGTLMGEKAPMDLQKQFDILIQKPHTHIILNMKETTGINSSCIGRLFMARKHLAEKGKTIKIRGCSDNLMRTFQIIKANQLIEIEP